MLKYLVDGRKDTVRTVEELESSSMIRFNDVLDVINENRLKYNLRQVRANELLCKKDFWYLALKRSVFLNQIYSSDDIYDLSKINCIDIGYSPNHNLVTSFIDRTGQVTYRKLSKMLDNVYYLKHKGDKKGVWIEKGLCEYVRNDAINNIDKIMRKTDTGYVYLIHAGGLDFKIGSSRNPPNRLKRVQTDNPRQCRLVFSTICENFMEIESKLHEYFTSMNQHNHGDWFFSGDDSLHFYEEFKSKFKEFTGKEVNLV